MSETMPATAKRSRGRRRVHADAAARQAAYVERQQAGQAEAEMARQILANLNVKVVKMLIDKLLKASTDPDGVRAQLQQHLASHAADVRTS